LKVDINSFAEMDTYFQRIAIIGIPKTKIVGLRRFVQPANPEQYGIHWWMKPMAQGSMMTTETWWMEVGIQAKSSWKYLKVR